MDVPCRIIPIRVETDLFQEVCKLVDIQKIRFSPRNLKGNGLAERFNKPLVQIINSFMKDDPTE
jgi:hypothetical protein